MSHLTCPKSDCDNPVTSRHRLLCNGCWFALPLSTRGRLLVRDGHTERRRAQLLAQIAGGTPLHRIEVTA